MRREGEFGKGDDGLGEMDIWIEILHTEVYYNEGLMMDKLRVGWGIRARRYENRIKERRAGDIVKEYWREKE